MSIVMEEEFKRWTAKRKSIFTLLAAAIAGLPGCAAIKGNVTLEAPSSGPTANVRVIIPGALNAYHGVRAYPNSTCFGTKVPGNGNVVSSYLIGFEKNLNGQNLGMLPTYLSQKEGSVQAEIQVAANRPITFHYIYPATSRSVFPEAGSPNTYRIYLNGCSATFSFIPEEGSDYELYFDDALFGICPYNVSKLTAPQTEKPLATATTIAVEPAGACPK